MLSLKQSRLSRTRIIIHREILIPSCKEMILSLLRKRSSWITSRGFSRIQWKSSGSGGSVLDARAPGECSNVPSVWTGDGFTWEVDPKLLEKLLRLLNLTGGKGALVPGMKDIGKDDRDFNSELECADAKLVQRAAGLEQCIALDRPDIALSVKTALQQMSKPTKLMKLRVVKVARYLKSNPRLIWKFPYQQQPKSVDVYVDADFAARETMLRSTSGVAEFYGRSPIEFGSSTQSVRALSTGESEFYDITKGSAHSLHSQAILKGFGVTVEAVALSDANAGIGIASRQGCGRLNHLEVKWLWVQEKFSEKALRLRKHSTETNIAYLATKYLSRHRMEMLLAAGNLVLIEEGEGMVSTS